MAPSIFDVESMAKTVPAVPFGQALEDDKDAAASFPLPQAIGHRGYNAKWPENTMAAFRGAVDVGAQCIETDLHLSADGVVVLSHDKSLKRCFGVDKDVADCPWAELATLKTLKEPHEPMPRFKDLLLWLAQPENEDIWLLLDVKLDDKADDLIEAIGRTLNDVESPVPWNKRAVVACWNATFLESACRLLPGYPLAITSFSVTYARKFLRLPNVHFNILLASLRGPLGRWFLRDALAAKRNVFVWTVNDERQMMWCAYRNRSSRVFSGVISDDPAKYVAVCERIGREEGEAARSGAGGMQGPRAPMQVLGSIQGLWKALSFQMFLTMWYFYLRYYLGRLNTPYVKRA